MSAVGLKLVTLLCFSCTALSDPERSQVVWKKAGETTTIECRTSDMTQEFLDLCRGLCETDKVVYMDSIENLTSADTAPYWCVYKKWDMVTNKVNEKSGGSVYLVVEEDRGGSADGKPACETDQQTLLLVTVVISAVVLFGFMLGFFLWITLKTKTFRPSEKSRRVPNNEVYEDMRSTLRR
ncbi:unnamed protein product [Pleuronectes platessa]|uniref:Ig-like domain-containing protein n=1 Tax=Pleuronectes platessa TaxID=8262 RepID=A0A9N7VDL1_PLEPL|nr:unnamed protein product [Pleuronectes platessa]